MELGGGASSSSFTVSAVNWYAAVLNWVHPGTNVDIYQCTNATYDTSSISPIVSNVSYDAGSTSNNGSYLIKTLNANTTYYYTLTLTGSKTVLHTVTFTTKPQPMFGGNGSGDTSVISNVNTYYGSPAVNAAYTKMLYSSNNPVGLYYCTSTNEISWSSVQSVGSTTDGTQIPQICLSYKGDVGLCVNMNGDIYSINWINAVPTATKLQTISSATVTLVSMNMDGTFAIIILLQTNEIYYSRYDASTQKFNTFVKSQAMPGILEWLF